VVVEGVHESGGVLLEHRLQCAKPLQIRRTQIEIAEAQFEIGRAGHSLEGAFRLGRVKAIQEGLFTDLVVLDGEPARFEGLGGKIELPLEDLVDDGLKPDAQALVVSDEYFEFDLVLRAEPANRRKDDLFLEQKMGLDGAIESKRSRLRVAARSARERVAQILEEGLEPPVLSLDLIRGALQVVAEFSSSCFHWLL
jgi:hypothetical protein